MNWKQQYGELRGYIVNHPEILISQTEISIPQSLRDEFYRRFDDLRKAVVECYSSSLNINLDLLSESYCRVEKEVVERLKLDAIALPVDLSAFVHNPQDGLMRILYTRTFDLLQGKITVEEYESQSEADLQSVAAELYRLGYEQWVGLTIIKLLDPDEANLVDLDEDYKPCLDELKTIAFGRQAHHPTLRIPEFVLHSRRLNKYVAVKMMLAREIETFVPKFKPPVRPRKKTGDTSLALDSRAMLISLMNTKADIPIIADIYELKRTSPDWIMGCISESELKEPSVLDQITRSLRALSPKSGMCLCVVGSPDADVSGVPEDIRTIRAGFDEAPLSAAIETLAG